VSRRRSRFTHGHTPDGATCLVPGCGLARRKGLPVCGPHWSKTPFDLRERLKDARGYAHDPTEALTGREADDMEYISAQHAIVEYLENES
jgi:hypothetical protein